jgi:hypothetical protein
MSVEQRDPAVCTSSDNTESKGEMTKAPINLRDLRRRIYRKAKAERAWRFWGLYVHVCKLETLREAYRLAKQNNGAPGIDGVTFEAIESEGLDAWLQQLRVELLGQSYCPTRLRRVEIPKRGSIAPLLKSAAAWSERLQLVQENTLSSLIDRVDLGQDGMRLSIKPPLWPNGRFSRS